MPQAGRICLWVHLAQPVCGATVVVREDGSMWCWGQNLKLTKIRDKYLFVWYSKYFGCKVKNKYNFYEAEVIFVLFFSQNLAWGFTDWLLINVCCVLNEVMFPGSKEYTIYFDNILW